MNQNDADYMAGQMVYSEFAGHESHGLRRLPEYLDRATSGETNVRPNTSIEVDTGSLVRMNGDRGFGHVIMRDATALLVDRAKAHGISAVAVRNSDFAGRFVDFCEYAAERGVITLMFFNSGGGAKVAGPAGALEPRLSTNPIAAGIPKAHGPHIVLDMATTAVAMGRVSEWRDRGEAIPQSWVNEAGVLQFMAGPKGLGLALLAEALAGALSGAGSVSDEAPTDSQGIFMIGINVSALQPLTKFTAEVDTFVDYVKNTPLARGAEPIRIPGESSATNTAARRSTGVELQAFTLEKVQQIATKYGVLLTSSI